MAWPDSAVATQAEADAMAMAADLGEVLLSPAFIENPYADLRALRETAPVLWSPAVGGWVLTRYDDVVVTFKDTDTFGNAGRMTRVLNHLEPAARGKLDTFRSHYETQGLIHSDPPDHTRIRRLVLKAFTPPVVEAMRPQIQNIVDELLDAMEPNGEAELIEEFAFALPVTVLAAILGVPRSDAPKFRRWADELLAFQGRNKPSEETLLTSQAMLVEARTYLTELIAEKRARPDSSLASQLVAAESEGDKLSKDELLSTCVTFLVAGHETTTSLIGNGVLALMEHPDQWAAIKADPSLVPKAVEEILRFESPVARQPRLIREDTDMGGQALKRGDIAFQMLGAANRDPERFDDPDRFDIRREPNRHIAFGLGPHFCIGAPLSRAEGQIALTTLAARFPNLTLAAPARWDLGKPNSRVLRELRVRW
jgi:pimeloyl-[acyl-carrier protein] synthase